MVLNLGDDDQGQAAQGAAQQSPFNAPPSSPSSQSDEPLWPYGAVRELLNDKIDPYALLEVRRSATTEQIEEAFKAKTDGITDRATKKVFSRARQVLVDQEEGRPCYDGLEMAQLAQQGGINAFALLGIVSSDPAKLTAEEIEAAYAARKPQVEQQKQDYQSILDAGQENGQPLTEARRQDLQQDVDGLPDVLAAMEFSRKLLLNPYARAQHIKDFNIQAVDDSLKLNRQNAPRSGPGNKALYISLAALAVVAVIGAVMVSKGFKDIKLDGEVRKADATAQFNRQVKEGVRAGQLEYKEGDLAPAMVLSSATEIQKGNKFKTASGMERQKYTQTVTETRVAFDMVKGAEKVNGEHCYDAWVTKRVLNVTGYVGGSHPDYNRGTPFSDQETKRICLAAPLTPNG